MSSPSARWLNKHAWLAVGLNVCINGLDPPAHAPAVTQGAECDTVGTPERAGCPMTAKGPNDTDVMPTETERTSLDRREEITDPDPRMVIPYGAPEVEDSETRRMLAGLVTRPAPPPIDAPETDGDLAAAYQAPARAAPKAGAMPPSMPRIVIVDPDRVDPTVRLARRPFSEPAPARPVSRSRRRVLALAFLVGAAATTVVVVAITAVLRSQPSDAAAPPQRAPVLTQSDLSPPAPPSESVSEPPPAPAPKASSVRPRSGKPAAVPAAPVHHPFEEP